MRRLTRRMFLCNSAIGALGLSIFPQKVSAQINKTLTTGHPPWNLTTTCDGIISGAFEQVGYGLEIKTLNIGVAIAALAKGELDILTNFWPIGWESHYNKNWARFEVLGALYGPITKGIGVPTYVAGIGAIQDLKGREKEFGGELITIEAGSAMATAAEKAIRAYDLKIELRTTSEVAMLAVLEKALAEKKPILMTAWRPNIMMVKYPLKMLEDPRIAFGPPEFNLLMGRSGFSRDFPQLKHFLAKSTLSLNEIESALLDKVINKKIDPFLAGKEWAKENSSRIAEWTNGYQ